MRSGTVPPCILYAAAIATTGCGMLPLTTEQTMRLELVPGMYGRLPTAGTDVESMLFNALCMKGLDAASRRFVMAHEIWHCAALHFVRRRNRHHRLWKVAVDHGTNHALGQQGLK